MRNRRVMELTSGNHIEYFSHEMTPEFMIILKDLVESMGPEVEEIMRDLV
jgi:hypothetical protein